MSININDLANGLLAGCSERQTMSIALHDDGTITFFDTTEAVWKEHMRRMDLRHRHWENLSSHDRDRAREHFAQHRANQIIDSITVEHQAITDDGMLETIIAIDEEDGAMMTGVTLHEWDSVNGLWVPTGDCRQCWLSDRLEAAVSQVRDRDWELVVVNAIDDAACSEAIRARRTGE